MTDSLARLLSRPAPKVDLMPYKYPLPTSPSVTLVMRGNRRRDTRPELRVRSELHRRGLRFRKELAIEANGIRVHADVVFPRARVAVFIDGCYWHSCPEHGTSPRNNVDYWTRKLAGNHERDRRVDAALTASGWCVIRVWEHETPTVAAIAIRAVVESRHRQLLGS